MREIDLIKKRNKIRKKWIIIGFTLTFLATSLFIMTPFLINLYKKYEHLNKVRKINIFIPPKITIYKNETLKIDAQVTNAPKEFVNKFVYSWVYSLDNGSSWVKIPNESSTNLLIPYNKIQWNKAKLKLVITFDDDVVDSPTCDFTKIDEFRSLNLSIPQEIIASEKMPFTVTPQISSIPINVDPNLLKYSWYWKDIGSSKDFELILNQNNLQLFFTSSTMELNNKMIKLVVSGPNLKTTESNIGFVKFKRISDIYLNRIQFWSGTNINDPNSFNKIPSPVLDRWENNYFEIQTKNSNNKYACVALPFSINDFELNGYNLESSTRIEWEITSSQNFFRLAKVGNKFYLYNLNPLSKSDIKTTLRANFYNTTNTKLFSVDLKTSFYLGPDEIDTNTTAFESIKINALNNNSWNLEKAGNNGWSTINNEQIIIRDNIIRVVLKEDERDVKIKFPIKLIDQYFNNINPKLKNKNLSFEPINQISGWGVQQYQNYVEITNLSKLSNGPNIFSLPLKVNYENNIYVREIIFNCFLNSY